MASIPEAMAVAIEHHQAGRLPIAEQIYRQILLVEPQHADALHRLGAIAYQRGHFEVAVEYFGRAIEQAGNVAAFHNNLGLAYQALRQMPATIACYKHALELLPDFAEAHHNMGNALRDLGSQEEAATSYRRAIELDPDFADAHNNLGVVLKDMGLLDEAVDCFRRAVELKPDYAVAHSNLGVALGNQGKLDQAIACHYRALEHQPDFAEALNNMGNVLSDQGKLTEAIACFRRGLELKPDIAETHNNLGNALRDLGQLDDAVASYRQALELQPDYAGAHINLGNTLMFQEKLDAAAVCFRRAHELQPDDPAALGALVHAMQHLCCWDDLQSLSRREIEFVSRPAEGETPVAVPPFSFLVLPTPTTAEQQLHCARQWVDSKLSAFSLAEICPARPVATNRSSRITIGYLSADFHAHATAWLMAELFEEHDRDRFAVFGYSCGPDDGSPMRQRLVRAFDRFTDIKNASFLESAQRIVDDEVDILVDLKGYTQNARTQIVALRPAPIQVNYLGYPGTMGAPFVDYILVDDFIVPPDQHPWFTEKLIHLPGCYQVNDSRREIATQIPSRAECGLPDQGFVFCSFNNSYKITAEMFGVWMDLLHAVPGSVLWLLKGNRFVASNLCHEAQNRGVAPERLVFAPRRPLPEHLARHRLADLFLDTFPCNAHTTASDALWTGCPVLTLAGETFVSRVAGSLLRALGLPELITTSHADYQTMALNLARNADLLTDLRTRLEANRQTSGLFNGKQFARNLEKAYASMWERYASGKEPQAFAVSSH